MARLTLRPATRDKDWAPFIIDPMSHKLSLSHRTFCALAHRSKECPAQPSDEIPTWGLAAQDQLPDGRKGKSCR